MTTEFKDGPFNPFQNKSLIKWFASRSDTASSYAVAVIGDGPVDGIDLAEAAEAANIGVWDPITECNRDGKGYFGWTGFGGVKSLLIVLGNSGIPPGLSTLISQYSVRENCPGNPRMRTDYWVYAKSSANAGIVFARSANAVPTFVSQEMFLTHFLFGVDLDELRECDEPWKTHRNTHEGLKEVRLMDLTIEEIDRRWLQEVPGVPTFTWPSTDAPLGTGSMQENEWPKVGMLQSFGYRVGSAGLSAPRRQEALRSLFGAERLPQVESPEYVSQWGAAQGAERLQKMAETIAALGRNAKRRRGRQGLDQAVLDWETDLRWLKRTYYDGHFDGSFPWPNVQV